MGNIVNNTEVDVMHEYARVKMRNDAIVSGNTDEKSPFTVFFLWLLSKVNTRPGDVKLEGNALEFFSMLLGSEKRSIREVAKMF